MPEVPVNCQGGGGTVDTSIAGRVPSAPSTQHGPLGADDP